MKNLFILANSYSTRTILYQIEYLFNFKIGNIYVLKENHESSELSYVHNKVELVLPVNMDKIIYDSDIILILRDKYIPQKTIEHINFLITEKNKLIIIDNPWSAGRATINKLKKHINYDAVPVILQVVFGEFTQNYCTEILLNKILSNEGVPFIQEFSVETFSLLEQLSKHGIVNKKIIQSEHLDNNNYSVVVKSLYINEYRDFIKNENFINALRALAPSYIVMNISSNCLINDNLKDIFIYKYDQPISVMVKSPYLETDLTKSKCGTYCVKLDEDTNEAFSPTSHNLENFLAVDLFAKISFPADIIII